MERYDDGAGTCNVGKQSLAQREAVDPRNELVERVKARAGTELIDGGGFAYVVTPEGAFRVTGAPPGNAKSIGAVITMTGPWARAWFTLVELLDRTGDGQCVEPPNTDTPEPSPEQSVETNPPAARAPVEQAPKPNAPDAPAETTPPSAPVPGGDLFWIATTTCKVKNERGANIHPEQLIPQFAHVRVLERKQFSSFTNVKVEVVDPRGGAGTELGWASLQHMIPLRRPARPSTAAAQMAAVLGAARAVAGSKPHGRCYANVKRHLLAGGGYGDILDIQHDERFVGNLGHAIQFHAAVQAHGAAALGLEEVSGLPMQAAPGTLLVIRGTAKNGISLESGDISVIDGVSGGVIHCYNDGHMKLRAKESDWRDGKMADSLVAMYRPIDRA